jgi:hypothetical protein
MKAFLFSCLFLTSSFGYGQVKLTTEWDKDDNLIILALNQDLIPHTVRIEFFGLENLESKEGNLIYGLAKPGKSQIAKLHTEFTNIQSHFNYNSDVFRGSYLEQLEELPIYLVPVQAGQVVHMRPLRLADYHKNQLPPDPQYVGTGFFFDKPTVICAPRKGIVSDMKMGLKMDETEILHTEFENFIELYHEDGSFTKLLVLGPGSEMVKLGDMVFPGQALAESSGEAYANGPHVKMVQSRWKKGVRDLEWFNFPIKVWDEKEGVLTYEEVTLLKVAHPKELVTKEMSKKEIKKIGK